MSLRAMLWALHEARDVSPTEALLLVVMADYADADGRGCHTAQLELGRSARCSDRTVRRLLLDLEARGLIRRGDQALVRHYRQDRRPVVWDLALPARAGRLPIPHDPEPVDNPAQRPDTMSGRDSGRPDTHDRTLDARPDNTPSNGRTLLADNPKDKPKDFNPRSRVSQARPASPEVVAARAAEARAAMRAGTLTTAADPRED